MDINEVAKLLARYDALPGISGREEAVADQLERDMAPYCARFFGDLIGNRYCVRKGLDEGMTVLITAHMDEIGFIVHDIDDDGRVAMLPVGMHNTRMLTNQVIEFYTRRGLIEGVLGGGKPIHQHKADDGAAPAVGELRVDIGAFSRAEAIEMGVSPGDFARVSRDCRLLGGGVFRGRATDNRSGVVAMLMVAQMLGDTPIQPTVCFCGTAQEEVGLRGAELAARKVKPDVALCLDVGLGVEEDRINPSGSRLYLGRGPGIKLFDQNSVTSRGIIVRPALRAALEQAAEKADVPYQYEIMLDTGTDANSMNMVGEGILSGGLAIPSRYIHTGVSTVYVRDVMGAASILAAFLRGVPARSPHGEVRLMA